MQWHSHIVRECTCITWWKCFYSYVGMGDWCRSYIKTFMLHRKSNWVNIKLNFFVKLCKTWCDTWQWVMCADDVLRWSTGAPLSPFSLSPSLSDSLSLSPFRRDRGSDLRTVITCGIILQDTLTDSTTAAALTLTSGFNTLSLAFNYIQMDLYHFSQ